MSEPTIGKDSSVSSVTPVPAVDIPDLKKKEKERKKAGAAWSRISGGGPPFNGAAGGNGVASTFAGAGRLAQNAAAGAGGIARLEASLISRLWATLSGKLILAGFTALIAGGLTLVGSQMVSRGPQVMIPNLGGIASSIRAQGADYNRLQYTEGSGKGQIKYDETPGLPDWAKKEPPPPEPEQPAEKPYPTLPHDLSGIKLTSQLGGRFGGKDIFSGVGGNAAPKFGDGFDRSKISNLTPPQPKGVSRAMRGNRRVANQRALAFQGRSTRAMGQLKLARALSVGGANAAQADTQKGRAADAFEQRVIMGGQVADPGANGQGIPISGAAGTGASGIPATDYVPPEMPDATGVNATPYQGQLNTALDLGAIAGGLTKAGKKLMMIGIILIAIGAAMGPFGIPLVIMGVMMLMMGMKMLALAAALAGIARGLGDQIQKMFGQQNQNQIVNECMDQAIGSGTPPSQCQPATKAPDMTTTIPQDVQKERNSNPELGAGKPL